MSANPASLRQLTIHRAANRCEYFGISQVGQVVTFHIDHIVSSAGCGETASENLVLACVSCSLRKGARQAIKDPETSQEVSFFNPRQQIWEEHFSWKGVKVVGLTATGRETANALNLKRATMLTIRAEEEMLGRHPPS